jgi:hypothetical protein
MLDQQMALYNTVCVVMAIATVVTKGSTLLYTWISIVVLGVIVMMIRMTTMATHHQ